MMITRMRKIPQQNENEKGEWIPIWHFAFVCADIFMSAKTKSKLPASSKSTQNRFVRIWHRRRI